MTEILFYHLERAPLEKVLPILLEKSLEKGWRAVVELGSEERLSNLDDALWSYRDDSFLPHGIAGTQFDPDTPVVLANSDANPNEAQIRFFVDRAVPQSVSGYERIVFLFNGHDPDAVSDARTAWKTLSDVHPCTYWQQDTNGRWEKKAQKGRD